MIAAALLAPCFAACSGKEGDASASSSANGSEAATDPVPDTSGQGTGTPTDPTKLYLALDGKTDYYVSYSVDSGEAVISTVEGLASVLDDVAGCRFNITSEKNGKLIDETDKEIFAGKSAREKYAHLYTDLAYGDWRIAVVDSSVVIAAISTTSTLDAIDYFASTFLGGKTVEIAKDYEYVYRAQYSVKSIKLDGADIADYSIVYRSSNSAAVRAAQDIMTSIARVSGIEVPIVKHKANMSLEKCIVVGDNVSYTSEGLTNYGDGRVRAENGTVYVEGKDIVGLSSGVSYLVCALTASADVSVQSASLANTSKLQERSVYLNDATAFVSCYDGRIVTPEEKLPLSYKVAQLYDPKGEVVVIAHRGEHTYYPENSLEGTISAWRIGAIATELDIQKTKDGHWVGMHDETLSRTTNVNAMQKQDPSLPTSVNVSDWTLAELRKLRLIDSYSTVTPFLIPTIEEVLHACDDRIFLHLDKSYDWEEDIFPIMAKEGVSECVYLVNHISYSGMTNLMNYAKRTYGWTLHGMPRTNSMGDLKLCTNIVTAADSIIAKAIVYLGDFVKATKADNVRIRDTYAPKVRLATWVLREADHEYYWRTARGYGYSIFLSDHPYELLEVLG